MNTAQRNAIIETLKSIGRGLWFGILGLVVVALTALVNSGSISGINVTVAGLTVNLTVLIVAVVGFIAKVIDKYVHENEAIPANGIAPRFLQG